METFARMARPLQRKEQKWNGMKGWESYFKHESNVFTHSVCTRHARMDYKG
jgi:hypothetical protein